MKLALLDDYLGVALDMAAWQRLAPRLEVTSFREPIKDQDALVRTLLPFDAVMCMRERTALPRAVIERLPMLRLIVTTGMWNAAIDIEGAAERGILVCGTRDVGHLTAELTLEMILALARRTHFEERAMREGRWHVGLGQSVRGRTLALLGLGNLGRQVARFGQMLGMTTIAWSQNLSEAAAAEAGCRLVARDALFREADYLTIHTRLSDRTRGLVGARELASMKPTAFLINTSRGPICDEPALYEALKNRTIAGAALDVYSEEPLPMSAPIRALDNVILLPHLGYVAEENWRQMYGDGLEAVEGFLAGTPVRALNAPRMECNHLPSASSGGGMVRMEGEVTEDERAIRHVVATWMQASRSGDTATMLSLMTEDVVFMVPGREPFGREVFEAVAGAPGAMQIDGTNEIVEIQVLGDWAFTRNRIELSIRPPTGEPLHRSGYTLTLFRKEADGRWRLARDANLLAVKS